MCKLSTHLYLAQFLCYEYLNSGKTSCSLCVSSHLGHRLVLYIAAKHTNTSNNCVCSFSLHKLAPYTIYNQQMGERNSSATIIMKCFGFCPLLRLILETFFYIPCDTDSEYYFHYGMVSSNGLMPNSFVSFCVYIFG